jgi:hypothetical protein
MDLFRHIEADWMFRSLMKAIAAGDALPITYADGSRVERSISERAREIARCWVASSLRFRQVVDESPDDGEVIALLVEVLGSDMRSGFEELADGARDQILGSIEMFIDPARVMDLPDDIVARSCSLCLSRARALAERGDGPGAFDWVQRARLVGPMTPFQTDDLLSALSAIAHAVLDDHRYVRQGLQSCPEHADAALLRDALHDCIQLVGDIVETILEINQSPEASSARLTALVAAIPVAIRLVDLRKELSSEDGDVGWRAVEALVSCLRVCLEQHPTHGRGWAVVALWAAYSRQARETREAAKLATHYGSVTFLERELDRIELDLGLTEDAG